MAAPLLVMSASRTSRAGFTETLLLETASAPSPTRREALPLRPGGVAGRREQGPDGGQHITEQEQDAVWNSPGALYASTPIGTSWSPSGRTENRAARPGPASTASNDVPSEDGESQVPLPSGATSASTAPASTAHISNTPVTELPEADDRALDDNMPAVVDAAK